MIFDVLDTPLESCSEALLSPNRSGIAEFVGVSSILETRRRVQITYQEAKLNATYSASVVEPATDLCFVLLKHTAPPKIVNIYPQIGFQSIGSKAWSASAKACMFLFLDVPVYSIIL